MILIIFFYLYNNKPKNNENLLLNCNLTKDIVTKII